MTDTVYVYVIPIVLGLSGIIWYYMNGSKPKSPSRPMVTTKIDTKPKVSPNTPLKKKPAAKKTQQSDGRPLKIFFGSQTGTAEDFSHKLAGEGKKYGFATEVIDMEEYDLEEFKNESFVMLVVATYGEGEPTDNARTFDEWIMDETRDPDELKNVKFTVFGLGNKTYEKYNFMGRKFDKRMEELGAERIFKRGEGDDDGSLEDDFAAWKREMWPAVCESFGMVVPDVEVNPNERRFRVDTYTRDSEEAKRADKDAKIHIAKKNAQKDGKDYDIKNPYLAKLVVNRELHTSASDRSCRHIEFEIGDALKYEVGDHLGVYAENDPSIVESVANRLKAPLDAYVGMYPIDKEYSKAVVGPCTVRKALTQYADLLGQPRKGFLRILATYATNEDEKKKLMELSDDKNAQPYQTYIKDEQRTVACILDNFPSVDIPFDHFLEAVPKLAPRMYSISSSLKETPGRVHITAVVVKYRTPVGRDHNGICTNWLARAQPGTPEDPLLVPVFIEKANFRLPKDPAIPIVMVGPGTGLAPFRGFIQERKFLQKNGAVGEAVLFFGCRSSKIDYIYADELQEAEKSGYLSNLVVAFSREADKKVYVQHKIQECGENVYRILAEKKGYLYICGDARAMAKDVHSALVNILVKFGNKTEEQAEQFLTELKQSGRYLTDTWF